MTGCIIFGINSIEIHIGKREKKLFLIVVTVLYTEYNDYIQSGNSIYKIWNSFSKCCSHILPYNYVQNLGQGLTVAFYWQQFRSF